MKLLLSRIRFVSSLLMVALLTIHCTVISLSAAQQNQSKDNRGLGVRPNSGTASENQSKSGGDKPEIVLQAGITSPQGQISFSPDGRLLASMGRDANSIKVWEVASGRLLRQLEGGFPSMGVS